MNSDYSESTREDRLAFIKDEFRCLKGREAEDIYREYIEGRRSFKEITIEQR